MARGRVRERPGFRRTSHTVPSRLIGVDRSAPRCSTLNSSIRYCALRPAPQLHKYRQVLACPRAAQKSATYRSLRFLQWQRWCRRQAR